MKLYLIDRMNSRLKGYLIGALAAASYGTIPLFALPLYKEGLNPVSVLLFRYLMALPIILVMLRLKHTPVRLSERRMWLPLIILGLTMGASSLFLFLSYVTLPAGIASTILFVYPIVVLVLMSVIYHEKMRLVTVVCIVIALAGIVLLYYQGNGVTLDPLGTFFIVMSALTYAIYLVGLNRTKLGSIDPLLTSFFVIFVSVFMFFFYLRCGIDVTVPKTAFAWFNIFCLATIPTVVSFYATAYAVQHIGSTPTAVLGALEPATAVTIGILVFNEPITFRIAIGLILVIVSVTYLIIRK